MWKRLNRNAFTLVEMLVVVALIVTLTAFAIPTVRLLTRDVRVREAGRDLQTFMIDVQTSARSEGHAAIWIERDSDNPNVSTKVFRAAIPAPFTGDFANSVAMIEIIDSGAGGMTITASFDTTNQSLEPSMFQRMFVSAGILPDIEIASLPGRFRMEPLGTQSGSYAYRLIPYLHSSIMDLSRTPPTPRLRPTDQPIARKFVIHRFPAKQNLRSVALPKQTYIDLALSGLSGVDANNDGAIDPTTPGADFAFSQPDPFGSPPPVIITLAKDGSIDWIYNGGLTPVYPHGLSAFLLLAMDERGQTAETPGTPDLTTLTNQSNLWLVLGRNGRVTLADMADSRNVIAQGGSLGDTLRAARQFGSNQVQASPN